jgi:hypothetical protein
MQMIYKEWLYLNYLNRYYIAQQILTIILKRKDFIS